MSWSLRQCFSFRWWILALCLCPLFVTSALAQQSDSRTIIAAPREQLPVEPRMLERRPAREAVLPSAQLSSRVTLGDLRVLGEDRLRPLPEAVAPPEETGIQRRILEDGTFETRYPDGRIRRQRPDGSIETVAPDGTVSVAVMIQVPGADLPLLPEELSGWGEEIGDQLLGLLRNILSEAEFDAYRQTEAGKDYYDRIDWRLRSLNFLTASQ